MIWGKKLNNKLNGLETYLKNLDINQTELIKLLGGLVKRMDEFLANNAKKMEEAMNWAKEFNRILMTEYAAGEQAGMVFSILYQNQNTHERRMLQVIADSLEKATHAGKIILEENGLISGDWLMEKYLSQRVPLDRESKVLHKVEKEMGHERPKESYIYSLQLARDKFCTKKSEKVVLDQIINNKKSYGSTSNSNAG